MSSADEAPTTLRDAQGRRPSSAFAEGTFTNASVTARRHSVTIGKYLVDGRRSAALTFGKGAKHARITAEPTVTTTDRWHVTR